MPNGSNVTAPVERAWVAPRDDFVSYTAIPAVQDPVLAAPLGDNVSYTATEAAAYEALTSTTLASVAPQSGLMRP